MKMETEDYTKMLPIKPPEGMIPWLLKQKRLNEEFLIYRVAYVNDILSKQKEKMVEVTCTQCYNKFYAQYICGPTCHCGYAPASFGYTDPENNTLIISGDAATCPFCRTETKAIHVSNIGNGGYKTKALYPMSIHMIDGKLALLGWCIYKIIYKDGTSHFMQQPYEAYVFNGKKCVRLTGYDKFYTSISFLNNWKQLKKCNDVWGITAPEGIFPWDDKILSGTIFENSHLKEYIENGEGYPVTYLRIWQTHKNIENIVVQGASMLLNDIIIKNCRYNGGYGQYGGIPTMKMPEIEWSENRPSKMLGITKDEFKYVVKHRFSYERLNLYKILKNHKISLNDMDLCRKFGNSELIMLAESGHNVLKTLHYILRQREKCNCRISISYVNDYWSMAAENGLNLLDESVKYPQNIVNSHDEEVRKIKYKKDKELIRKFKNRYSELERFCWANELFEIRPASNESELINEGSVLHHCVGTYAKRHANGNTAIFFIRKINSPEEPYYTLELDEKTLKVKQNRGLYNCERTPEVEEFEKDWLEYIRKIEKENKKYGKSNSTVA